MSEELISFTINDNEVSARPGQTVLEVAREKNIWVPTMCYHPLLEPEGSCRLCLVEIEAMGRRRLVNSCSYPVAPGIKVYTDTDQVVASRKLVAELLLARCSENPKVKEVCASVGVTETPFPKQDHDCMLCGLCVQMCQKRMQVGAIGFTGRGYERKVTTPHGEPSEVCITCGACEFICPTGAIKAKTNSGREPILHRKDFDEKLATRGNIDITFPSAVPLLPSIDRDNCVHFNLGSDACKVCQDACPAGAIDYEQTETTSELDVGALILCPGLDRYNPAIRAELGFGRWKNVVSSLQFERILSASGPFQGVVQRPGDGKHPRKVAWIQCVGSRDQHNANPWCSSVCCMYATKQAVIAREHDKTIEPTIFYMEMRAFGKDFDKYIDRAKSQYNVRYQRAMISAVREEAGTQDLVLRYSREDGTLADETFDLVVLSVGLEPYADAAQLAKLAGIELNDHRFAKTTPFTPIESTRPGVFVTGTFQGPKDIPETVMQGSSAAGEAMALLAEARGTETIVREPPPERDITGEDPRIGAFICSCGINIAGTVDVNKVVKEIGKQKNVVHCENLLYSCSQDSQEKIKKLIKEKKLNRVVVASCTPRTHAPLFQETLVDAGLNKYMFELADIREQCSWCHMGQHDAATKKATDITRMIVAKARNLDPVHTDSVDVTHAALIIGGGAAGMTSALALAEQGFEVHLVEREPELGGLVRHVHRTLEGADVQAYLRDTVAKVQANPRIHVHAGTEVKITDGFIGNFKTTLTDGSVFLHGVIIVTTGGIEYQPTEYLYGQNEKVLTQRELEARLESTPAKDGERYVMIQCVGSREEPSNYCSRVCCQDAIKNAIKIKERAPGAQVAVLYRDLRTYGLREDYYAKARELGVLFVRYEPDRKPEVSAWGPRLMVKTHDFMLDREIELTADWLVLSTGLRPHPTTEQVSRMYKITRNPDGYFLEAHVKLRPVDFASEGLFLAGLAHAPKNLDETISQALAAAGRAGVVLSHDKLTVSGVISKHNQDLCMSCLSCLRICPFGSPYIDDNGKLAHNEVKCMGCGLCAGVCPAKAFQVNCFRDDQVLAIVDAATEGLCEARE
jgi:heterodisulfide reductase subunit A2